MWTTYLRTLGLTAVQGMLVADATVHAEHPNPTPDKGAASAPAEFSGPITEYELHYGIVRPNSPRTSNNEQN